MEVSSLVDFFCDYFISKDAAVVTEILFTIVNYLHPMNEVRVQIFLFSSFLSTRERTLNTIQPIQLLRSVLAERERAFTAHESPPPQSPLRPGSKTKTRNFRNQNRYARNVQLLSHVALFPDAITQT